MTIEKKKNGYEIIIQPNRSWFYIDWRGLLYYRDLLFIFVKRDYVSRYKQTILGPMWFMLQPLITTLVFVVIFNRIAKISTDKLPPFLFYLCGVMVWNYFANCVQSSSKSLLLNASLFEKVYFPRLIAPVSSVISNLFPFAIQFTIFLLFYAYFKYFTTAGHIIDPNISYLFLLPFLFIQAAAFSLGVGLWVSALTTKYRDLVFLMEFLIQLWMYATPVVYPVSSIPPYWRFILALNPMAPIVDLCRYAFFGTVALSLKYLTASIITTLVVLLSGVLVFNKVERTFVDTI